MAGDSRGILVIGALSITAFTGFISIKGETALQIPLVIFFCLLLIYFFFSMLNIEQKTTQGSTPTSTAKGDSTNSIEGGNEDLPDPAAEGFELPLM